MTAHLFKIAFLVFTLWSIPIPINAQQDARLDVMNVALELWMKENAVKNATMTVFGDKDIFRTERHGEGAKNSFELASLSKSITGACIAHLVAQEELSFDTRLSDIYGVNLEGLDLNAPQHAGTTIAHLLTHSSGFYPDSTQKRMPKWVQSQRDRHERVAGHALGRKNQEGIVGRYQYNNENYAILGEMIAAETGKTYLRYCKDAVIAPAGLTTSAPSPNYGAYAAWGGWEMSTEDFARFVMGFYNQRYPYGAAPFGYPHVPIEAGVHYGLGSFMRRTKISNNYWHHGAICIGEEFHTGAFFAFWGGQVGVVVAYDKCPNWDMMIDLDIALGRAALR